MARFPTTTGERNIPTPRRGVSSVRPGIEASGQLDAAQISGRAVQDFGSSVNRASDILYAREQEQKQEKNRLSLANAKSRFLRDQIAIETEFDQDQEWGTFSSRYDEKIKKAKTAAAESISDPTSRSLFEADADVDIVRGAANVASKARAKETDSARAGLNDTINNNLQASLSLPNTDREGQSRLFKVTGESIDSAFKAGYITAQEAQAQKEGFAKSYADAWIKKLPAAERLQFLVPNSPQPQAPIYMAMDNPAGLIEAGNIDLTTRPQVKNGDEISTVLSMSYQNNRGEEVLIPMVSNEGKIMAEDEAKRYWGEKGQFLGKFKTPDEADAYAQALHEQQDAYYSGGVKQTGGLRPIDPSNDRDILTRIAQLESNGNPDTVNPKSGAAGLFQFMPETARQYGLADPKDPKTSAEAAQRLLNDNRTVLRATLGREPTPAELYLAHQQGATGAAALLENPDKLAITTLAAVYGSVDKARAAIVQNGGQENMTSGQFANLWTAKFDGKPAPLNVDYEVPAGGYDFSKKTGTPVDYLPVEQRMQLIESAFLDMKADQDKARVSSQVDVSLEYNNWLRNAELTGQSDPVNEAKILAAFPDTKGADLVAGLKEAAQNGKDRKVISGQTLAEDQKMLDAAAADASTPGSNSAKAAAHYDSVAKVIKAKHDELASDPGGYVQEANPHIADAWQSVVDSPEDKHAFRSAILLSQGEQRRLGLRDDQIAAIPKDVAQSIVDSIKTATTPKDQLDSLLQFVDTGDPQLSRQVMSELFSVKDGLPAGSDLIADIAIEAGNRPLAEKLWTELHADTSQAKMDKDAKATLEGELTQGIIEVLAGQAEVTGDFTGKQAGQVRAVAEQIAKARGLLTGDYASAAKSAAADLQSQFAMISDDSFAHVYYPAKMEDGNPGAIERGLLKFRMDVADQFPDDPYSQATARDIEESAVWVNGGDGFDLIVPGTTRTLKHVTMEEALGTGMMLDANPERQKQWPLNIPKPDGGVEPMVAP